MAQPITALRSWMRRTPQPVRIVADGKTIEIGQGPKKWADAEETVFSLGATRIEAIGANGSVLRAATFDAGDDSDPTTAEPSKGPTLAGVKLGELGDLGQLALILSQVADSAAKRHEESYRLAFGEMRLTMGEMRLMFSHVLERQTAVEQAWQMALNQIAELKLAMAEAAGQQEESALTMLAAAAMPQLGAAQQGKANGHKAPANGGGKES